MSPATYSVSLCGCQLGPVLLTPPSCAYTLNPSNIRFILQLIPTWVYALTISCAIMGVQLTNPQPQGDCTDHVQMWLWVYMGAIIVLAAKGTLMVQIAAKNPMSASVAKAACAQYVSLLFNFAWWITGCVWYSQAEDIGCNKPSMDLMLAIIIMPGVFMGLVCCAACFGGQALLAKVVKGNQSPEQQQQHAAAIREAMAAIAKMEESTASPATKDDKAGATGTESARAPPAPQRSEHAALANSITRADAAV